MNRDLSNVKREVRERYLGKCGIHGVGASSADGAVKVYAAPVDEPEQREAFEAIRGEVAPFGLEIVFDEAPRASDDPE